MANPISGQGRAARRLGAVEGFLRGLGIDTHAVVTRKAGDAREAASGVADGLILSFGGDGTFNEVLNGADLERCVLGVLPAGTGNVLAKELGLLDNPISAVGQLAEGGLAHLDLGVCNGRRFISMCGAGADAYIVREVHKNRRRHLTKLHYLGPVFQQSLRPIQWGIRVTVDGQLFAQDANAVCVGNTRSYGGPVVMTSAASPIDGAFDVIVMRIGDITDMCAPALGLVLGSLHACPDVRYTRGRSIELSSARDDVLWQVDGEAAGNLPVEIVCQPARVKMVVPRSFDPRPKGYAGDP